MSADGAAGRRAGFVLAGGESARMGRDKALLPYGGKTLVEHVARAVREAAGTVTLVGAPERYKALGLAAMADQREGCGPLAGIETALMRTRANWNLIVACDMPLVEASYLRSLLEAAEESDGQCLAPVCGSARRQPLCAVYHRSCLEKITEALEAGVRKVAEALERLRVVDWPVEEDRWLANINTAEDWMAHRAPA